MSKPRLLDLFSGAGGAAAGYARAGFLVTGVDHRPQPHYLASGAVAFHQADALEYLAARGADYDVIHASPPCQVHSAAKRIGNSRPEHRDLLPQILALLGKLRVPWVIENVPGAPLFPAVVLCGTQFGLPLRRHRLFHSNVLLLGPGQPCRHHDGDYTVFGHAVQVCGSRGKAYEDASGRTHWRPLRRPLAEGHRAMGVDWMTQGELSQAIPPAYSEFIGRQLRRVVCDAPPS